MRIVPLSEVAEMGDGEVVPSTKGKVSKVFSFNEFTKADGESGTVQNLVLVGDGRREVNVKLWNQSEIKPRDVGKLLYLLSVKNSKNKLSGLSMKEETWQDKKSGEERSKMFLVASDSAEVSFENPDGDLGPEENDEDGSDSSGADDSSNDEPQPKRKSQANPSKPANRPVEPKDSQETIAWAKTHAGKVGNVYRMATMVAIINRQDFLEQLGLEITDEHFQGMTATIAIRMLQDNAHLDMPGKLIPLAAKKAKPQQGDPESEEPTGYEA